MFTSQSPEDYNVSPSEEQKPKVLLIQIFNFGYRVD